MELGETVEDTARREVWEETGLRLGAMSLYAIYSGVEQDPLSTFALRAPSIGSP